MTHVVIPRKRKCPGTFDNIGSIGVLSFESRGAKIDIQFTKQSWKTFIADMLKVTWKEVEHHGRC